MSENELYLQLQRVLDGHEVGTKEQEIGLITCQLYILQVFFLGGKKPAATAAALGYYLGLYDCALQMAGLELNATGSQSELKDNLTYLFDVDGHSCFQMLLAGQELPEFQRGQAEGGKDYHRWIETKGRAMPTGLPCSVNPVSFRR